jgi:hypothetical protein
MKFGRMYGDNNNRKMLARLVLARGFSNKVKNHTLLFILSIGVMLGNRIASRQKLHEIDSLFQDAPRHKPYQKQFYPVVAPIFFGVLKSIRANVREFRSHTKIPKEVIVFVKPSD